MSFFEILTCGIVVPVVTLLITSIVLAVIYNNTAADDELLIFAWIGLVLSIVVLFVYVMISFLGVGPRKIDAMYYHKLLMNRDYVIERIENIPEESKNAYQKEIDKLDGKIEKQRKAMSYGDWEQYYKMYEEQDEQK